MPHTKSLLVIDDDDALCNALKMKFEGIGYDVTVAKDGDEAEQKLDEKLFDVILTDLHMPNKDGFAVLEYKKTTQNADVPAYVITNLGSDKFCEKAEKLGAKKCFVKSLITLRDVVEMIDGELASS